MKISRIAFVALTITALSMTGIAHADETSKEGYLIDSNNNFVRDRENDCWRTGTWTPEMANVECDPELMKKEEPVVAAAETPAVAPPAPEPAPAPAPAPFVTVTLQAEALFDFNKSSIHPHGKKVLDDEVVSKLKKYPQIGVILITGYADRIGTKGYNQALSQRRADAVKAYLIEQGIADKRIETAAKGESDPVVSCDNIKGKVSRTNRKLVDCLQPNRRITVDVNVQKPAQQ